MENTDILNIDYNNMLFKSKSESFLFKIGADLYQIHFQLVFFSTGISFATFLIIFLFSSS